MYTILENNYEEEITNYLKKEKNISDEDVNEVQMILSMMDEAIVLYDMKNYYINKK